MSPSHTTTVRLRPHPPEGMAWKPLCTCGWAGEPTWNRRAGVAEATAHREAAS